MNLHSNYFKTPCPLTAAGRTDTGVHARCMVAHFNASLHGLDLEELPFRLNQLLPKEIAIHTIQRVKPKHMLVLMPFHVLMNIILLHKNPFFWRFGIYLYQPLDLDLMNEAASLLLAYTDFECFSKSHTDVKLFCAHSFKPSGIKLKKVMYLPSLPIVFLRNMVRAIVGTLLEIGLHKKKCDDLHTIIRVKIDLWRVFCSSTRIVFNSHRIS